MSEFQRIVTEMLEEVSETLAAVDETALKELQQVLIGKRRIFVAGRGRSGLQMRAFAMRLMHLGLEVHVVDEITTPAIEKEDVLLIGSGSGRTESLVQFAQAAKEVGAEVALVTGTPKSPIGQESDLNIHLPAPTPKSEGSGRSSSVQPLGSRFELSLGVFLDGLVLLLMEKLGVSAEEMFVRHVNLE